MDRPQKTLADYVAIAIGPVLIMALVGSLVFFLLEVLYVGQYQSSLQWILFFFVFGAVLVSRVAMTSEISGRAGIYGLVLGLLTWLALLRYVEYPPGQAVAVWGWAINLILIVIIWWSAHRLTWDCTLIDDSVDASGAGLLEAAGLENRSAPKPTTRVQTVEEPEKRKKKQKDPGGLWGWFQRYRRHRQEAGKKPHAPGVWVVYFSLAALPIYGVGQSQIPPEETDRRRYVFWLMCIYVGSGLGLLLTTSFLGLRRYLRQRSLTMPAAVTSIWLMLGASLVAAFLFFGAILPRPGAPVPLLEWAGLTGSQSKKASRQAQVGDPGSDQGRSTGQKGKAQPKDKGGGTQAGGKEPSQNKDKSDSGGKDKEGNPGAAGKSGDEASGKDKQGPKGGGPEKGRGQGNKGEPESSKQAQERGGSDPLSNVFQKISSLLKWVVLGILGFIFLFFLLRGGLRYLANFTHWAKSLLEALSAWWKGLQKMLSRRPSAEEASLAEEAEPPRSFASYPDPFDSGAAERMTPAHLVRYSFAALTSWSREHRLPRLLDETPLEFVHRLSGEYPALEADARRLGDLYVDLAYAARTLSRADVEPLRDFWLQLAEVQARPLSASLRE